MERLYFKVAGDHISIMYRPTHEYLSFVQKDEAGINEIKRLLSMPTEEFYDYIISKRIKLPQKNDSMKKYFAEEKEKAYKEAWKYTTERLMKEYNITMTDEEIPYDYIHEKIRIVKKNKKRKTNKCRTMIKHIHCYKFR